MLSNNIRRCANIDNSWDILRAVYIDREDDAFSPLSAVTGIFVTADGLKLFVSDAANGNIHKYDMSEAGDVTTAILNQTLNVTSYFTDPNGLFFKPDGLMLFVADTASTKIYKFTLSTAWDLSTKSYDSSFDVGVRGASRGLFFKPDGTIMYVASSVYDVVSQYALSTPWVITSAAYYNGLDTSGEIDSVQTGVAFNVGGDKITVFESNNVHQYISATPWSIANGVYSKSKYAPSSASGFYKLDGSGFYVGGGDNVRFWKT